MRASIQRRVGFLAPLGVLVLISGGFVLLADGSIIVGCVILLLSIPCTWLAGLWSVPNSVDAYVRKMTNLLRGDFAETVLEVGQQKKSIQETTATISMLEPPPEDRDFHVHVVSILQELDDLGNDDRHSLVERTIKINELQQQLAPTREEIAGSSTPYLRELASTLDARVTLAGKSADAILRPLRHQSLVLARIKIPGTWLSRHQAYASQLDAYLIALENYYDARNNDGRVSKDIACSLESRKRELSTQISEFRAALWSYYSGADGHDKVGA